MHTYQNRRARLGSAHRGLVLAGALVSLAGCDFKVTNPGPTADKFLADTLSLTAQVNGVAYSLGDGMNYQVLHSAVSSRELFPTGQSGQFGIEPRNWVGYLVQEEQGAPWNSLSRARWLSDQSIIRLKSVLGDATFAKHPLAAQGLIWRGFTYRVLGEAMCVSIIDKGPATPPKDNLVRAESAFTAAIEVATAANNANLINAAYAGRAQVRVDLGDWTGAVADAAKVPWWPQAKYMSQTAGVNLATGREARLIEAEAALRGGDVATAMAKIDANRASASAPVAARPATLADAWTLLKQERGIELWLEGRRMADMRRWAASQTPGALDPLEVPGAPSYLEGQNTCFPVSRDETNTNPNLTP